MLQKVLLQLLPGRSQRIDANGKAWRLCDRKKERLGFLFSVNGSQFLFQPLRYRRRRSLVCAVFLQRTQEAVDKARIAGHAFFCKMHRIVYDSVRGGFIHIP